MANLSRLFGKNKRDEVVTVVSGLPRSGTSMLMKMLEAGGLPAHSDELRAADKDNPKGYYEFERVKKLPDGDKDWLVEARGKAVKVIAALLEHLPQGHTYKVVFMQRKMEEILASQKQMLVRSGKPTDKVSDEDLAVMYQKHLAKVLAWLNQQPNFSVMYVDYNDLLANPEDYPEQISEFLGLRLDTEKMIQVVDPSLYRQRQQPGG